MKIIIIVSVVAVVVFGIVGWLAFRDSRCPKCGGKLERWSTKIAICKKCGKKVVTNGF